MPSSLSQPCRWPGPEWPVASREKPPVPRRTRTFGQPHGTAPPRLGAGSRVAIRSPVPRCRLTTERG